MKMVGKLLFLTLVALVSAQVPIPKKEVGFVYKSGSPTAPVLFDVYIDVSCGDSVAAWPIILQVADHYGPASMQLTIHLFPLPYLRNGFTGSKGAHIVEKETNKNKTYEYITKCFDNFNTLKISATMDKSDDYIIDKFADIAVEVGLQKSAFMSKFRSDSEFESVARVEWKYACTRGVSATPTFMLNDVMVDAWEWTFQQWKTKIDTVLGTTSK